MSKELEALERLCVSARVSGLYHEQDRELIVKTIQRLESIDNAKPSEALECLEELGKYKLKQGCLVEDLTVYDTIKQALIQMERCLGARRNYKALEQMYQLVKYSKAPMKAALWVTNIDGKIEQRVIVEKKDYDIKSEKEQAWEYMKEVFKTSSTYTNKLKDSLEYGWITQEKYDFIMEMLE